MAKKPSKLIKSSKSSKVNLQEFEIRSILALIAAGNDAKMISELLKVPKLYINKILKNQAKYEKIAAPLKGILGQNVEMVGEMTRILKNKRQSSAIGKKLVTNMTDRFYDYKTSWEADSLVQFNAPARYTGIVSLADLHLGHEGVNYDRLMGDLNLIAQTPGMYIAFLGDPIDNFISGSKHQGALISAVTSPKDQLYMLNYLLTGVLKSPKDKMIFVVKDNHVSARLKEATGIDWSNKMWDDYGVFYGGDEVRCELNIGKLQYTITARHQYRGGSRNNMTLACKNLLKEGKYSDTDIVMLGHRHEGATEIFHYRGTPRCMIQASTYKTYDPYAKRLGYDDPNIFMPTLILSPNKKEYTIVQNIPMAAELLKKLNKSIK